MQKIFISHDTTDDPTVNRIYDALEAAELDAWVDHHHNQPGDNWNKNIQYALHECPICVFVLSAKSAQNDYCAKEWLHYVNNSQRRLYVVLIGKIPYENYPWALINLQYADLTQNFEIGLTTLISAIKGERLIRPDDPASAKGLRLTGDFPAWHLDIPLSGRNADLQNLRDLLAEERRLLVLMAVGGRGKTRLAAELAIKAEEFTGGVLWHTISEHSRPDDLTYSLREHLDLDPATPTEAIWGALAGRKTLIILDNAESCTDIPAYAHLLERYPMAGGARVLMTSRQQWRETRKFNRVYDLPALSSAAAEQIVQDMATQQSHTDAVTGHEAEFAEAARYHPRLIQYGLGWLHDYELKRVLKMLRELRGGEDVEEALDDILHKTLRQIQTAPNGEKAIADLHKLLVCEGGFTDPAAEAILGDVDSLGTLRRWNLLGFDQTRYWPDALLEAALDPDPSAQPAHYDFYHALVLAHHEGQDYQGLAPESANLAAAFEWAMEAGELEKALWLANTCGPFLHNRGRFEQALAWAERVAAALAEHPDKLLWASAQNTLGICYVELPFGDQRANLHHAMDCYQNALIHYTPQAAPLYYAGTQNNLAVAYRQLSELEDRAENLRHAIDCYQNALIYCSPQTTPLSYAGTQNNLGLAYRAYCQLSEREDWAENLRRAIDCFQNALIYRTPQSAPLDYAATQYNLGNAYADLAILQDTAENLHRTIDCYQNALIYYTPQATPVAYANTQQNLGLVKKQMSDLAAALRAGREAEKYYRLMDYIDDADEMLRWIKDVEEHSQSLSPKDYWVKKIKSLMKRGRADHQRP